ncbi:Translation initiation factor SU [Paragonimus heterotremus]|uniref:Translation initiation factor SU n=1 Tax=Paragonimus heterotremus TaxID=100268 RepID=A0A8J4SSE8_9TREM|nr:Translation initiation factor SU [Paragonimus heterotremus]
MSLQNLQTYDPFAEEGESTSEGKFVHIRIQQRNGRKTITTVQGLHEKFDKKKILKQCKKDFACNGTVVEHDEYGEVIQLQGDQRDHMKKYQTPWILTRMYSVKNAYCTHA